MPESRETFVKGGSQAQTMEYVLAAGVFQQIESVLVEVDATAAGDVRPTLFVATPAGAVMAAKRQGEAIPGGDTGSATWALRLADESPSGSAFAPVSEYINKPAFTWDSVPLAGSAALTWNHSAGANLLDLTVPAVPVVLQTGTYAISTVVIIDPSVAGQLNGRTILGTLAAVGGSFFLPLGVSNSVTWSTSAPAAPQIGLSMVREITAGEQLFYFVTSNQPVNISCALGAMVVRLA